MDNTYILTPFYLDNLMPGLEPLVGVDWTVNKPELPTGNTQQRMAALYRPLAETVSEIAGKGHRPVSIAGDCCTVIGVLAGLQRAGLDPTLIWFDAHGDFNTWETTPSGFLGGMPLAMLSGRGEQTMPTALGLRPQEDSRIILTDGRDLDPGERELLDQSAVSHVTRVEDLLSRPLPSDPLYVHFDTDVIDPQEAPAMNYCSPGGPSVSTLTDVFRLLADTKRVVAVSLSTWNPALDEDGRSQEASMSLLRELLL